MTAEELRRANAGLAPDGSLLPGFSAVGVRSDGSFVDPKMYQDQFTAGYTSKPFTGVSGAAQWAAAGNTFVQPPAAPAPLSGAEIPAANTATARVYAPVFDDAPSALEYPTVSPTILWVGVAIAAYLVLK